MSSDATGFDPAFLRTLLSEASLRCDVVDRRTMGSHWVPEPFRCATDKLYVMFSGSGWVRLDGERWNIEPGRVWLFPAGTLQQGRSDDDDPMDHLWVHFSSYTVKNLHLLRLAPPPRCIGGGAAERIAAIAAEIVGEWRSDDPSSPLAVTGLLTRCLVEAYRTPPEDVIPPDESVAGAAEADSVKPDQAEAISDVIGWLGRHYGDELTLAALAERACMASSHFSRIFKSYVGMPPMKFLESHRMRRAQAALVGTNVPVHEIAISVGYADPYYFSRAFRRFAGCSPTAFRAEALRTEARKSS